MLSYGDSRDPKMKSMVLLEQEFDVSGPLDHGQLLATFAEECERQVADDVLPIRFVITASTTSGYHCELGVLKGLPDRRHRGVGSIFDFRRREFESGDEFNAVLLVPTGIGAEIGGHAGDAGPVARMLAQICDTLILHPNVVNASDLNEMPHNSLYVEGSVITRLLMGTVGLQAVRSNRVLVMIDAHRDELFVNAAVNAVSGARASYGLRCAGVVCVDPPVKLRAQYAASGRAAGRVEALDALCAALNEKRGHYDAVAISSVIQVPHDYHQGYFDAGGEMVNPWGGVEAIFTHALSTLYNVPTAHSPMFESREIANADPGIVDPRMAAEAVSVTFLQCTLKGLQRSPRIVTHPESMSLPGVITARNVSCLIIPDGCLGLPTLAALQQGIPVVAVRENRNLMRNHLSALPWADGQFHQVANYWEAAGVVAALRAGIEPESVRRPLAATALSSSAASGSGDVAHSALRVAK
jgi:hypothetical protein